MNPPNELLAWAMPAALALAGLSALAAREPAWRLARAATGAGIAFALAAVAAAALPGAGRTDAPGLVLGLLIAVLGWIIVRFSHHYLEGETGQRRYVASLLLTLAAAGAIAVTGNLLVLLLAWTASSLGLHHLLLFYRDRPPAQIAAHKKFIVSRLAEGCLLAALGFVYAETGTLSIDAVSAHVAGASGGIGARLQAAALLLALAATLKTAQLPLHGWLIQVMEAPTPVSALLHAGIVNIGGFVLIRLAELVSAAPAAQALLLVSGSTTAVLAGLVMMTRVSIKVRLAWSTCAQMGFMLMEIGLGLYELALLHLVAHSLYKAHAFLTAGETVAEARRRDLEPASASSPLAQALALPVALALIWVGATAWSAWMPALHLPAIALLLLAIGLAPLLWGTGTRARIFGAAALLGLFHLYLLWHLAFAALLPPREADAPLAASLWVAACFAVLYGLQAWLRAFPQGRLSRRLYPWAYGGFYLDERFTRFTFRFWPARLDGTRAAS